VAVVTGAASGIGRALANRFAVEGMKVVLADIEADALDAAVRELRQQERDVIGVLTDVAKADSVENLAREALKAYGKVHILCNNAGVGGGNASPGSIIWEASLNDWLWVTSVNYWGVAHGIRIFVPIMLAQDEEGHVVNTASAAGLTPGMSVYGATKAAVVSMSESLYSDFERRKTKLGVTVLCPSFVSTRIGSAERNRPPELRNEGAPPPLAVERAAMQRRRSQMFRIREPAEVAEIVMQAIRDKQLYLTTDTDFDSMIEDRMQAILGRRNPTPFLSDAGLRGGQSAGGQG